MLIYTPRLGRLENDSEYAHKPPELECVREFRNMRKGLPVSSDWKVIIKADTDEGIGFDISVPEYSDEELAIGTYIKKVCPEYHAVSQSFMPEWKDCAYKSVLSVLHCEAWNDFMMKHFEFASGLVNLCRRVVCGYLATDKYPEGVTDISVGSGSFL